MKAVAITTTNNPYSPLKDFDSWFFFDSIEHDYGTVSLLARFVKASDNHSDELYMKELEVAIDSIVQLDLPIDVDSKGNKVYYRKVVEDVEDEDETEIDESKLELV